MRNRLMQLAVLAGVLMLSSLAQAASLFVAAGSGLQEAIAQARPGDVLRLGAGDHRGPLTIDKPMSVIGEQGARVIGDGVGTVVRVTAGPTLVAGLEITGSGPKLDNLDAGIAINETADKVLIENNCLVKNLIGIDVQGGTNVTLRGNVIVGRSDLHKAELGSGIYVWNAPGLLVENNTISKGRDGIFVTTSSWATYRANRIFDLRFAFHSMYANDIVVEANISHDNDMGFAFMYSRRLVVRDNFSARDRTHGVFLNFVNQSTLTNNAVRQGGEKCLFVYNSNDNHIEQNLFEGCDIGIHFTAGSADDVVAGNAFINNRTQVKYVATRSLDWSFAGRGNYWSDHAAFDMDGNGIADTPYRPNDSVDRIVWSQPMARLLLGSPAVQLIRWAQSKFPALLPGGVIDSAPLMSSQSTGLTAAVRRAVSSDPEGALRPLCKVGG